MIHLSFIHINEKWILIQQNILSGFHCMNIMSRKEMYESQGEEEEVF